MKRVVAHEFGPPSVLVAEHTVDPALGDTDVRIGVSYAGVTFVETQVRSGHPPWSGALPPLPYRPGNAVEGRVLEVGNDVDPSWIGTRVCAATGGANGYAEAVVVDSQSVIPVPESLHPGHAVALLADGRTALSLSRAAKVLPGEVVLITAAAGGVGSLLVQLAIEAGAGMVVAVAGGQAKCDYAKSLGAHVTIDYRALGWSEELATALGARPLDVVFDGVGGGVGTSIFQSAPPRTRFLIFGMASGSYSDGSLRDVVLKGLTVIGGVQLLSPEDSKSLAAEALTRAAEGRLTPTIGQVFPLERAADAHAAIEGRSVIGKTLLQR